MVAARKGKVLPNPTLPIATKIEAEGGSSFEIYTEPPDKIKLSELDSGDGDASFIKRKSVAFSKRRHLGDADVLKSGFNNSKEIKGKLCNSVKKNAERKVLGDISNVKTSYLRSKVKDRSKYIGTSRSSISGTQSMLSSSDRSYKTFARTRIVKPAANHSKLEKVSCNDKEACLDDLGTQDDELLTATTKHKQTSGLNRLPPTRKSFPVRKQVHEADTFERKEKSTTKSVEQKGTHGFAVKPRVGRVSYAQSRLTTVSRDKYTKDAGIVSRRSTADTIDTRSYGHRHLPPIRKSFPVNKPVTKTNISRKKEVEIYTGKSEGKKGYLFPVKPKVGRKSTSCASYVPSQPWKNRRSDGHMIGSKVKHDMDARLPARRSVKTSSKSKSSTGSNKMESDTTASFMSNKVGKKGQLGKPSSSACVGPLVPNEIQVEQVSALSKSLVESEKDNTLRRNRGRRKSFTSLLVSKLKEEDLPSIYDDQNHLEVSEYVDDIYNYYWVVEAQSQTLENYLEFQPEITSQTRAVLINWLIEVHLKFDLMQETLFLMVTLLDQYLSLTHIKKNEMQLAGLTALFLASKYEDFWHPRIMDLISVSAESYARDQMLGMESSFLKVLKFRLNAPTPYVFMIRFLKAAQLGAEVSKKFEHLAFYLIELCLVEYEALKYKPSLLCASAIYVARCTMRMTPTWTPLLRRHSKYDESQLRQCAEMILKCQKAGETNMLKVTYEKYKGSEFSNVAVINPLKMVPQKKS